MRVSWTRQAVPMWIISRALPGRTAPVAEMSGSRWRRGCTGSAEPGWASRTWPKRGPRPVIAIIGALEPRQPWEPAVARTRRVMSCPRAALVLGADVTDLAGRLPGLSQFRSDYYSELLASLGLPVPSGLHTASAGPASASSGDWASRLTAGNPDRWTAVRELSVTGDARSAGLLIDAYFAAAEGDPQWVSGKSQLSAALSRVVAQRRHQSDPGWLTTMTALAAHRDSFLRATGIRGLAGLAAHQDLIARAPSDDSPQSGSRSTQVTGHY